MLASATPEKEKLLTVITRPWCQVHNCFLTMSKKASQNLPCESLGVPFPAAEQGQAGEEMLNLYVASSLLHPSLPLAWEDIWLVGQPAPPA